MASGHASQIDKVGTFEVVCKNIYTSCDPDNSNQVSTSKLIDFIRPYLEQHPYALESLQANMDPENKNVSITYQTFADNISVWAKNIGDSHEGHATFSETLCNFEASSPLPPLTRTKHVFKTFNTTECNRDKYVENNCREQMNMALTKLLKGQLVVTDQQLERSQIDSDRNLNSTLNLDNLLKQDTDQSSQLKEEISKKEKIIDAYTKQRQGLELNSPSSGSESPVQDRKRPGRLLTPVSRPRRCSTSVFSVRKQQSLTNLRHSAPICMVESERTSADAFNSSLPTVSTIASEKDLDDSIILSTCLDEHQPLDLEGCSQASLQAELIEAQGSISRSCDKDESLRENLKTECDVCKRQKTDENRFNAEMKKEIEKLRQLCNIYEETIQNMKSHSKLEQTNGNCNSELDAPYKMKFNKMETEIISKNKEISSLEDVIQKHKGIINIMWTDLKKCKTIMENLEQENKQLKEGYERKCQDNGELLKRLEMNQLINQFNQELPITCSQNDQINTKDAQITEYLKEIAIQKKLIRDLTNEIKELTEREQQFSIVKQDYEEKIYNQTNQLTEIEHELNVVRQDYVEKISCQAQQLKQETEKREKYDEQIDHQANQLEKKTNLYNIIKQKYKETIAKIEQLEKELKTVRQNYEEEIARQAQQLKQETEKGEKYEQRIEHQAKQLKKEAEEREKYEEQIDRQAKQLEKETKQYNNIKQEYKEKIAKIEQLEKELKIVTQKYDDQIARQAQQLKQEAEKAEKYEQQIESQAKQLKKEAERYYIIEQKYKEQIANQAHQLKQGAEEREKYEEQIYHLAKHLEKETKQYNNIKQEYKEKITKIEQLEKELKMVTQKYDDQIARQAQQLKQEAEKGEKYKEQIDSQAKQLKKEAEQYYIIEQKYKEEIASQALQLADAEVELKVAKNVEIAQMNQTIILKDMIEELTSKVFFYESERNTNHENTQAIVNQLSGTLHNCQVKLLSQTHANNRLRHVLSSVAAANSLLSGEVKQLSADLDEKMSSLNTLNNELENVTKQLEEQSNEIKIISLEKERVEAELANKITQLTDANNKLQEEICTSEKVKQILEQTLEREISERTSNETFINKSLLEWSKMLQQSNIDEFASLNLEEKLLQFNQMISNVCMALQEGPMIIAHEDSISSTSLAKKSSESPIPTEFDEATLTQDETCSDIFRESLKYQLNENPSTLSLEFQLDEVFPLTSTFLQDLGIQDDILIEALMLEEREELFNKIIAQINPEKMSERINMCKEQCQSQYMRFHYLIKDISVRLRDHKCIGALAPVNPVFILLEDLRLLLQEIMQSSSHLGALMCEETTVQHWNFLIDYMKSVESSHRKDLVDKKIGPEQDNNEEQDEVIKNQVDTNRGSSNDNKFRWYGCAALIAIFALIIVYWQSQRDEPVLFGP